MVDEPVRTYVVSVVEAEHWRAVLTTKDKAKALAWAREIGDKVRVDEITSQVDGLSGKGLGPAPSI
ncbi:hypothetical protein X727_13920 [Mesorhizobium sp. L103C119B0]|uniref:hypothetical protein n=1 Tax=Mesorhizobium sp. L103C119B0 TaxID=1287085 RepID=UPI0003CFBB41|nr:hypothetical protein [Mesorhizobium sp. L103C119B0]ESZ70569.1 hypothetical protein X727_13920 [Mesorhizobium sp. L103C119B0]